MPTSRRQLLKVTLGSLPVISMAASVPSFVAQFASAQQPASPALSNDNILVVVQLTGGNDGLNTVIPVGDDAYFRARPKLALKARTHRLDDHFALHPAMDGFKRLFDDGRLAVVHGCGYPNPSRSHFRSMEVYHTANPTDAQPTGWLGHYLDHAARGGQGYVSALNIGTELPQALVNQGSPVPSIQNLEEFRLRSVAGSADARLEREIVLEMNKRRADNPALQFLARQATNAVVASEMVHDITRRSGGAQNIANDGLGRQLQIIGSLIAANAGTRLYYTQLNGFDTHASQLMGHEQLLAQASQSIAAFHQNLATRGFADKVTVLVFSEFGRRVAENSSQGTDHGAAAPMFVIGGKVKGGLHGRPPSLTDLDDGDLKHTTDFRRVYATLLDKWLNTDSTKVLAAKYEPLPFL